MCQPQLSRDVDALHRRHIQYLRVVPPKIFDARNRAVREQCHRVPPTPWSPAPRSAAGLAPSWITPSTEASPPPPPAPPPAAPLPLTRDAPSPRPSSPAGHDPPPAAWQLVGAAPPSSSRSCPRRSSPHSPRAQTHPRSSLPSRESSGNTSVDPCAFLPLSVGRTPSSARDPLVALLFAFLTRPHPASRPFTGRDAVPLPRCSPARPTSSAAPRSRTARPP